LSLNPDGADLVAAAIDRGQWQDITYNWAAHARDDQLAPVLAKGGGRWHTWLVLGGRGSGKTRTGAEWIRAQAAGEPPLADRRSHRIALIGDTIAQVRSVMIEGVSGRLAEILRDAIPNANPSWGVNRLRSELYDLGFRLVRPTDSPGHWYRNDRTGEEVRIMERPEQRNRRDSREKYTFSHYYRYRPGFGRTEGAHTPIPDR
jgi:hypothetical protein